MLAALYFQTMLVHFSHGNYLHLFRLWDILAKYTYRKWHFHCRKVKLFKLNLSLQLLWKICINMFTNKGLVEINLPPKHVTRPYTSITFFFTSTTTCCIYIRWQIDTSRLCRLSPKKKKYLNFELSKLTLACLSGSDARVPSNQLQPKTKSWRSTPQPRNNPRKTARTRSRSWRLVSSSSSWDVSASSPMRGSSSFRTNAPSANGAAQPTRTLFTTTGRCLWWEFRI